MLNKQTKLLAAIFQTSCVALALINNDNYIRNTKFNTIQIIRLLPIFHCEQPFHGWLLHNVKITLTLCRVTSLLIVSFV